METTKLVQELRKLARYDENGKMGDECVVNKSLLKDAADRLEQLSKLDEFIDKWNSIGNN